MPPDDTTQPDSDAYQLEAMENKLQQMQEAEYKRNQIRKAKHLATQTRYQNAMRTVAQTKGQIVILSEQLVAQEQECQRLEGILEYLQSMPDQCNAE